MRNLISLINPALLAQAKQLGQIDHAVKSALPASYWPHIAVAGIHDQELLLITRSSAWSTRLRMHTNEILYMLEQHTSCKVNRVRIQQSRSAEFNKTSTQPGHKLRHLSEKSARLIRQTADNINDAQLKQALQQLAKKNTSE